MPEHALPTKAAPPSLLTYSLVITRIGLTSFGGGLSAWMMRIIVQERAWMTETEFLTGLALCQVFPGVNTVNLAIWIGYRLRGNAGAVVGALSMIVPGALVLIGIAVALINLATYTPVRAALDGVAAAAIGLGASMGVRAGRRSATRVVPALIMAATFAAVGLLHWPLVPVVAVAAPISIGIAYWQGARHAQ